MALVNQLMGAKFVMVDGAELVTELPKDLNRVSQCLSMILQDMTEHEDMVVGLDITWFPSEFSSEDALLTICTRIGCVLVKAKGNSEYIRWFFGHKEITFVGVHAKENFKRLRKSYFPWDISNAVDLGELAADVLNQPRLRSVGVRRLASEVLLWPFKSKFSSISGSFCMELGNLSTDQIEGVTMNAYAAYMVGKKLFGF